MQGQLFGGCLSSRAVGTVSETSAVYDTQQQEQLVFQAVEKESL